MAILKGGTRVDGNLNVLNDINAGGTIYGTTKSFNIEHPLDDSKRLIHGCLEGPEHAVYYRGEGTLYYGITTIVLPTYFESLTLKEGRTIQITPFYDFTTYDSLGNFDLIATTRINEGSFIVFSNNKQSCQKFYWEVKAIRSDVEQLVVEPQLN